MMPTLARCLSACPPASPWLLAMLGIWLAAAEGRTEPAATLTEEMDAAADPYNEWAYGSAYNPVAANARVSPSLQLNITAYDYNDPWLDGPFLTGNWGGLRRQLFEDGFQFSGVFAAAPLYNPSGLGPATFEIRHEVVAGMLFDFERMADLPGASLYVGTRYRSNENWRLLEVEYRQTWFEDRLEMRIGRLIADTDFATAPITYVFINPAINGNVDGIFNDIPFTSGSASWGVFLQAAPVPQVYAQLGAFATPDGPESSAARHGVDFSLGSDDGILLIGEVGWEPGREDDMLPGSYFVGGYIVSRPRDEDDSLAIIDFRSGETTAYNLGVYGAATQMVYRETGEGKLRDEGLTLFATSFAAPPATNVIPFYASAGAVYVGLIPGRDRDQTAIAFAYGNYSADFSAFDRSLGGTGGDDQAVVELTYAFAVTPWLVVQPDLQILIHPEANSDNAPAYVFGAQVAVTF